VLLGFFVVAWTVWLLPGTLMLGFAWTANNNVEAAVTTAVWLGIGVALFMANRRYGRNPPMRSVPLPDSGPAPKTDL
jgi:hypothetical protein